jgi:hypothetical protein
MLLSLMPTPLPERRGNPGKRGIRAFSPCPSMTRVNWKRSSGNQGEEVSSGELDRISILKCTKLAEKSVCEETAYAVTPIFEYGNRIRGRQLAPTSSASDPYELNLS